jgi:hypothetical protein
VYNDRDETLTITGSDHLGLPTALDVDVIIALLYLTKRQNNFTKRVVNFTRYQLIDILGWPDGGHYYNRLEESLDRWTGVTLIYKRSWWDNNKRSKGNLTFHILDAAKVLERSEIQSQKSQRGQGHQLPLPLSWIRWSEEFFQSCRANNLKKLDLEVYFSLSSSISKQLYRFLDKRFYKRPDWSFDLRTLACEHVGLSRNYPCWKIKQKLQPALKELISVGFLKPMPDQQRYVKTSRGEWKVTFQRNGPVRPKLVLSDHEPDEGNSGLSELECELVQRGVTPNTACELVAKFPEEQIRRQVEQFDYRKSKGRKKFTEPGGYLTRAIQDDFSPPDGFETKAERTEKRRIKTEKERQEANERRRKQEQIKREEEIQAQVLTFWNSLTPYEQATLDKKALEAADPEIVKAYEANRTPGRQSIANMMLRRSIRDPYIRRELGVEVN